MKNFFEVKQNIKYYFLSFLFKLMQACLQGNELQVFVKRFILSKDWIINTKLESWFQNIISIKYFERIKFKPYFYFYYASKTSLLCT
jgi:hypothetical protein